ncbi:tetratricopeptide repeat protein [Streptomyces sp. NPDC058955]|uniref:AfsR/SARP family transcriptional regulator n=1 Tax=unclassified Streptomyces TaxID=2593676 RepID=UPI003649EEED
MVMRFGLLGTLSVTDDQGGEHAPGSPMARALLAALLLAPGRVVGLDRLESLLWDGCPPATARASLHNHVSRLRRSLGDASRVTSQDGGLLLRVEEAELDTDRLAAAFAQARRAHGAEDWREVVRATEEAAALWRGDPLAEFPRLAAEAAADVARWQEARLQCLEFWADASAALGQDAELLTELRRLTAEFPLRETFQAHLLLVLHRAGHRAEALEAYHALRRTFVDTLGVEPGPGIRSAFQHVLDDDHNGTTGPALPKASRSTPVPRALPRDPVGFTGREMQIDALVAALRDDAGSGQETVGLHTVDGMPGIGKTAFALRVAHHVSADYPDGQIFLPLHAHTAGTPPVTAEDALGELLLAVGESPGRLPEGLTARAGLWRSCVAGRRMVIVLDDARGSDQVEPLLPGTPGCLIIVTSRRRLEALAGATPVTLGVLPEEEAVRLLIRRSGRPDLDPDDPSLARLAELCGRLPLALNLVSARLRHRRGWTPADIADDLGAAADRLATLSSENVSVAAAFDLSRHALTPAAGTLLRRLGLLPGVDLDAYAAAALYGTDPGTARRLLDELCDHSLVDEPTRGRYQMHDLIREYTRTLAGAETPADADIAVRRLLAHYLHTASDANRLLVRDAGEPPRFHAERPTAVPRLTDATAATQWLRAEQANLRAAVDEAVLRGQHEAARALPAALHEFLRAGGHWDEATRLHRIALDSATATGNPSDRATALHQLAIVSTLQGRYAESETLLTQALELIASLGDPRRAATVFYDTARLFRLTGRYDEAVAALTEALRRFTETGDRHGEGQVLIELGHVQQLAGRYPEAAATAEAALAFFRASGDLRGLANSLATRADILRSLGHYRESTEHHREALVLYRRQGNLMGQANVLADLGDVLRLTGADREAEEHLTEAVQITQELGSPLGEAHSLTYLARLHLGRGDAERADALLTHALALCEEVDSAMGRAYVTLHTAEVALLRAAPAAARAQAGHCLGLFEELGDLGGRAAALHVHALALRACGEPGPASDRHHEALTLARSIQAPYEEMRALVGIADCLSDLGDPGLAAEPLRTALAIAERLRLPEATGLLRRLTEVTAHDRSVDVGVNG